MTERRYTLDEITVAMGQEIKANATYYEPVRREMHMFIDMVAQKLKALPSEDRASAAISTTFDAY